MNNAFDYPKDKPILFAANHPNAIMEGIINCCIHHDRPMYLVARGDIFLKPRLDKLFRSVYLLPIFRLQDGRQLLHRNERTFDECVEIFKKNGRVMIFPEALCVYEKRLRKLRNGTAKMAVQAYKQGVDLYVVCVGVNYTSAKDYRSELMLDYAPPIQVATYKNLIETNENQAITALTNDMEQLLRQRVVHIQHDDDTTLTENLLVMARNNFAPQPYYRHRLHDHPRLGTEHHIAEYISNANETDKNAIKDLSKKYHDTLHLHNTCDAAVAAAQNKTTTEKIIAYITTPIMAVGYVLNMLPFKVAQYLTIKSKVIRTPEFYATINWTLGFVGYITYLVLMVIMAGTMGGIMSGVAAAILLPVLGYHAQIWAETIEIIHKKRKYNALPHDLRTNLEKQRKNIIEILTLQP